MTKRGPQAYDTPLFIQNNGQLLIAEHLLHPDERAARLAGRARLPQRDDHLGERFRWLRAERSLAQIEAATGGQVGHSRLGTLEQQRLPNPGLSVLFALQLVYGCGTLDELLGDMPGVGWAVHYSANSSSLAS